jgi:heavy metal efflux system protein
MFVTRRLQAEEYIRRHPFSAILHLHDRDWVFVPAGGNDFKRVEVTVGDMLLRGQTANSFRHCARPAGSGTFSLLKPRWRRNDSQAGRLCAPEPPSGLGDRHPALRMGHHFFHRLPVEAYPDVANNYVDVIAQWPGISAEQIEQQVTIPLETVMNGIPGIAHVRSWSIFGLSTVEMVFGEYTTDFENRERVLERLSQVTPASGVVPQMGTDWSPVGQIYFYTLESSNPEYDVMNLKSLETWVIEKNLKSVPGVVDINPFGGPTREYQVRLDPDKLIDYGLSIGQVEQQLTNNNANAGGSFIEEGAQQVNIREVGLVKDIQDIGNTVITTKGGTPVRVKDLGVVTQGPDDSSGQIWRAAHLLDGRIIDNDDVVSGIAALQKGADAQPTLDGIHQKVKELNDQILPKGVKIVPFIDRSELLHFTTHTVLHNLTEGMILVVVILFLFLGNARGALIVALTIPFSLLFAAICLDLKHIPANLLSLGALDFGMVVDGAVVMVENIVRHLARKEENGRSVHVSITRSRA